MKGDICANPDQDQNAYAEAERGREREREKGERGKEGKGERGGGSASPGGSERRVELVPFLPSLLPLPSLLSPFLSSVMTESEGGWVAPANTTRAGFKG